MANNKLEKKLANIEKKRAKKQQNQEKKEAKKIEQQEKKRERMLLKVESKQEKKRLEAEIKKERIHQKSQQKQENKTRKLEKKEYKKIAKAEKKEQKKKIAQENKRLKAEIKAEKKKIKEEEKAIKKQEKEAKKPPKKEKPKKKPKPKKPKQKKPKQKKPKKEKKPKEKKPKEKKSKEKNPNDKNTKFDIKSKIASINPIRNRKKDNTPSGEEEIVEGKKPKNKLIIIVAFALALTGIVFFVFNKISSKGEDKPKTQIEESKKEDKKEEKKEEKEDEKDKKEEDKKEEKKEERKPIDDSNFKKVKEFTIYDKDGKKVSISDYKGRPVIINFWASWCVPCKNEIPYFKNIQKEYGEEVEVLMVNITDNVKETKERALEYIEKSDLKDMNVLFDLDEDASKKYKLVGLPSTLFLTENGKVMNEHLGLMDEEELKKNVNKLLGIEEKAKEGEDKTEDTKKE